MKKQVLAAIILLQSLWICAQNPQQKPNIVLFFIDDMGWQDCSVPFYKEKTKWNSIYHTPNMEKLAAQGMKCTHAYASPVCSPSRVSLMTGMNPLQHKVTNWTLRKNTTNDGKSAILTPPQWHLNGISPIAGVEKTVHATTLPVILKQNGYTTIHVGKAHLGADQTLGSNPLNLGFDINVAGHAAGAPQSYEGLQKFGNRAGRDSIWGVPHLKKYWNQDIFLTEALTLEALAAIDKARQTQKPFFLHFAHYAIHTPIMGDKRFLQKYYAKGMDSTEAKYASLIEGMDKSLGDVMQYLEQNQLDKNTLIIFLSDNGGLSATTRGGEKHQHNTPLRSGKGSAYEGGMRIPFIVKWAGVVSPHSESHQNLSIEDVFPTVLSAANIKNYKTVQKIDGQNITPIFKQKSKNNNRFFYWHYPHVWGPKAPDLELYSVIRQGAWKLIYFHTDQHFELYNTEGDISEQKNLFETNKKIAFKLAKQLGKKMRENGTEMPTMIATNRKVPYPDVAITPLSKK
jgi:arylsulfatase A-like enzyme